MAFFQVKLNPSGRFYFVFCHQEDFSMVSRSYADRAQLEESIVQLRKFSDLYEIIDRHPPAFYPCFLIHKECSGQVFFQAYGLKGDLIMTSMPFHTLAECQKAIAALKQRAKDSKVQDLT
ncbi:YegP family protein [Tindallia californiensis]|uniref:DUF1508 domain-containing protein n=1 Tax=Tindallia californiensis TaxID=159292 RepID=A0A1H3P902_9FIRM|nr:hypothetical protein [Tindallia californiensis]SDY97567.1 hypothetical protein SAMN05192546_10674 [Tindallia californiensis]